MSSPMLVHNKATRDEAVARAKEMLDDGTYKTTRRAEFASTVKAAREWTDMVKADEKSLAELNALGGSGIIWNDASMSRKVAPQLKSLHTAAVTGQSLRTEVPTKDILGGGFGLPPTVSTVIQRGDYPANVANLADLFPHEVAAGPTVRVYRVLNVATAAQVAEGAVKPMSGLTQDHEDIPLIKFAVRDRISREAIMDYPAFQSVLSGELVNSVISQQSTYAVTTALAASGIQVVTNASLFDGIATAKSQLLTLTGWKADAVVVNPADLATAEQAKASTSGVYFMDILSGSPEQIHGVPTVASPAMPVGQWLLGSFKTAGRWFDRENVMMSSGMDGPDFSENMTSIIVESRAALGITRASHLVAGKFA